MRSRFLAALLILAGSVAAIAADDPPASERSTGNLASSVKPPVPQEPIKVAIPAGESRKLVEGKAEAGAKFSDYFDASEPIAKIPSHRALALLRGRNEEVLSLSLLLVMQGEKVLPSTLAGVLANDRGEAGNGALVQAQRNLTEREKQILICLLNGYSNKHIARALAISEGTVKVHLKSLMKKIAAANRTQAALLAEMHLSQQPRPGSASAPEGRDLAALGEFAEMADMGDFAEPAEVDEPGDFPRRGVEDDVRQAQVSVADHRLGGFLFQP